MHKTLLSPSFLISTLLITIVYISFTTYLMNIRLVIDTLGGSFSLDYKLNLMIDLFGGMWTAMSGTGLILLFLTAILTGANLTLLTKQIRLLRKTSDLHFVVGGNTFLGLAGAGCAACGLPVLSLLGLSGAIIYLPLRGTEILYLAIILLSISFYLLSRSIFEKEYCPIPLKK